MNDKNLKRKLLILNAEGKEELELNDLLYRKEIVNRIKENPNLIDKILESTENEEEELFDILSGKNKVNVIDLDHMLKISLKK